MGDGLIFDSCVGNALAHYVHNLLFWCGKDAILSWGEVESVEAELVRAHAIESFDTVFARGKSGETEILLGATHAGSGESWHRETFDCELAKVTYNARGGGFEILWHDGRRETGATPDLPTTEFLTLNIEQFAVYLGGEAPRPLTTLADSRPFVHLNDLIFVAAKQINTAPDDSLRRQTDARGQTFLAIAGIEATLENFLCDGLLPSESGAAWGQSGGRATRDELPQLEGTIDAPCASFAPD